MDYKHRVYYQLLNYAFLDSNGSGMGDFKGIATKLSYLKELGVGGIWLSPVHKSMSYHSYDVLDYRSQKEDYIVDGYTLENLIADAKKYDIAIMLDMVFNHTGLEHSWFQGAVDYALGLSKDATFKDFYVFSDKKPKVDHGWYQYKKAGKSIWYYASFDISMPDLNFSTTFDYDNDPVFNAVLDVLKYWVDKGVYAFRLDAIRHFYEIRHKVEDVPSNQKFLKALCDKIKQYNKDVFILGEAFIENKRLSGFAIGVDSVVNFPVAGKLTDMKNSGFDIIKYASDIQLACKKYDTSFTLTNIISSHDEGTGRFSASVSSNLNDMYIAAILNIMIPGIPLIYYGDEVGMLARKEYVSKRYKVSYKDAINRTPMPWNKNIMQASYILDTVKDKNNKPIISKCETIGTIYGKSIEDVVKDSGSLYHYYRSLIDIRNKHFDLFYKGNICAYNTVFEKSKVLYYDIEYSGKTIGVIINTSTKTKQYNIDKPFAVLHTLSKNGATASTSKNNISMPAISVSIIKYMS